MTSATVPLRAPERHRMPANQRRLVLASPPVVVGMGYLTARVGAHFLGGWAWVPLQVVYWSAMTAFVIGSGTLRSVVDSYRRGSRWPWWLLAFVVGVIPMPILLLNLRLLHDVKLVICWLALAIINPFFEEGYWRATFGEATAEWPGWLACLYPTLWFTAGHPLQWGVFSMGCRNWQMVVALLIMGTAWSAMYRYTRSLRAATFSHFLVDVGNMTVWVWLNLYVPAR